jgi:hypothetical protein
VKPVARKKSNIRAIDQGTPYDVTGRMRRLVRDVEAGHYGEVTDAIVILRGKNGKSVNIQPFFYGKSETEVLYFMASRAQLKCLEGGR